MLFGETNLTKMQKTTNKLYAFLHIRSQIPCARKSNSISEYFHFKFPFRFNKLQMRDLIAQPLRRENMQYIEKSFFR